MLPELTRHIMVQKNNGKTKKKQHARLPAKVPASSVSKSPGGNTDRSGRTQCQAKKTGNIKQTNRVGKTEARGGKRRRTVRSSATCGGNRKWCLRSEEFIVPSHARQNDLKASVDNTWQISPFRRMLLVGAFVLNRDTPGSAQQ